MDSYSIDYILHSHIPSKRSPITVLHIDSVPVVKVWIDRGVIGKEPSKSNGGRPGFGRAKRSHAAIIAVCFVPTPPSSLKVHNPTFWPTATPFPNIEACRWAIQAHRSLKSGKSCTLSIRNSTTLVYSTGRWTPLLINLVFSLHGVS